MSFEVRPLDITEYKGDAIVNSLGIRENINVYGKICESIVKECGSPKIKGEIAGHEAEAEPGHMFVTSGYKLPAKNIIHVCTPFFSHDQDLFALEFVYKSALVLAYKNKWYKLAFPIIGTGANGYPHAYVLKMVVELVNAFSKLHKEMQITICMPVVSIDDFNEKFDKKEVDKSIKEFFKENKELESREFIYDETSFEHLEYFEVPDLLAYSSQEIKEVRYRDEYHRYYARREAGVNGAPTGKTKFNFLDLKEALLDGGIRPVTFDMTKLAEKSVAFYIETYIEARFTNQSDQAEIRRHVNRTLSGSNDSTSLKAKHGKEEKRTTITLPMLMRYILALHMTKKEADDFLLFCGKVFSPVSDEDKMYQGLISNKKYVTREDDVYKINGFCLKYGIHQIFDYIDKEDAIEVDW